MNAAVSAEEKAAILAHYTAQAAMARAGAKKRGKTALVCLAGKFECEASYSTQGGAVFLDELCFDTVNWIDASEFLLPSAIRLIEADIEETLREYGND
jgi:hypothetical protein